jgi:hypothetical protein
MVKEPIAGVKPPEVPIGGVFTTEITPCGLVGLSGDV